MIEKMPESLIKPIRVFGNTEAAAARHELPITDTLLRMDDLEDAIVQALNKVENDTIKKCIDIIKPRGWHEVERQLESLLSEAEPRPSALYTAIEKLSGIKSDYVDTISFNFTHAEHVALVDALNKPEDVEEKVVEHCERPSPLTRAIQILKFQSYSGSLESNIKRFSDEELAALIRELDTDG